jgi:tetratricopeptide (TPR) repeat protein
MTPETEQRLAKFFQSFVSRDYEQTASLGKTLVFEAPTLIVIQLLLISLLRLDRQTEVRGVLGPLLLLVLKAGSWERLLVEGTIGAKPSADALAEARTAEQRCQAHFYAGALHLTEGRMDEAREAFDACLEVGVAGVEAQLAKVERVSAPPPSAARAAATRARPATPEPAVLPSAFSGVTRPPTAAEVQEAERLMPQTPRVAGAIYVKSQPPPPAPDAPPDTGARTPRQLIELAVELYTRGRYREALPFAARAVELQREAGDEKSADFAACLENLAGIYEALGQYPAADPLYRRALELRRGLAQGRMDHPYFGGFTAGPLGRCLSLTAGLYRHMGRFAEAEALLQEAVAVNRKALGEHHPSFATTVTSLADVQLAMGKFSTAESLYRQAIETTRQALGEKSPTFADRLVGLATLHTTTGSYEAALSLLREAQGIEKAASGENAPSTLNALADLLRRMGEYAEAERLLQQAVDLRRARDGEAHPGYAMGLNNLAELYRVMGRYPDALRLWKQSLELKRQTLGEDHPSYGIALNNLAEIYRLMGDDASAESLLRQALGIFLQTLGEDHTTYATVLNNLGALYEARNTLDGAEPYFRRALEVHLRTVGDRHPLTAASLNNLGSLLESMGRWNEAADHFQRAADCLRQVLGERHPDYGCALHNLGRLRRRCGQPQEGEALLRESLQIEQAALGEDHPSVAATLVELAAACVACGREREALELNEKAAILSDRLIGQVFSMGSDRQRLGFLATLDDSLAAFLSLVSTRLADDTPAVQAVLDVVLRRKAIAAEALATQREAVLGGRYPALASKFADLSALRMRISQKSLAGPGPEGLAAHRKTLAGWAASRDQLEAELAREVPEMNLAQKLRAADRQAVSLALPEGAALVEFVRHAVYDFRAVAARGESDWKPPRYLAFVLLAGQPDQPRMVDLGEAEPIDRLIATFRSATTGEEDTRAARDLGAVAPSSAPSPRPAEDSGDLHAAVFAPLLPALEGRTRLFLAPDGDLNRLAFEVIPSSSAGRRLIDDYHLSYLGAGRDVMRFAGTVSTAAPREPIVVADPDFDLGCAGARAGDATTAPGRHSRDFSRESMHFGRLPGTRLEGERIAAMLGVTPWVDASALEARVKSSPSPRILHLATHGFFLANQKAAATSDRRGLGAWSEAAGPAAPRLGVELENPLLRSGVALAGANTWCRGGTPPEGAEDGILTAEDVSGLDLGGTEMVVLSACETGLGEVRTGEGVFGLRRAFVLAGARTLVMSLWKVPDQQTQELMEDLYRRVLQGQPRAEALRDAQLALKARYPDPLYWGAFICQGDPRPLGTT